MKAAGRVKLKSEHSVLDRRRNAIRRGRTNIRKHQRQTPLLKCVKLQIVNTGISEIEDISRNKTKSLEGYGQCEIRDDKYAVELDHNYAKIPRRVVFTSVNVYYFRRTQGFCTQPSDGEIALGMEMIHSHYQRFKVDDNEEKDDVVHDEEEVIAEEEETPPMFCEPFKQLFHNTCDMFSLANLPLSSPSSGLFTNLLSSPHKMVTILHRDIFSHPPPPPPRHLISTPALFRQAREARIAERLVRHGISVQTLLDRARLSFQSFHNSDHIDTLKILEIVPHYIARHPMQNISRRFRRRKRRQEYGSQGIISLTPKARISLLRSSGINQIDLRESSSLPSSSGCSCPGPCCPRTCSCALEGVQCCVETTEGPCTCAGKGCFNQEGRRVYDNMQVDMHFIITLMDKGGGMKIGEDT